MTCNPKFRWHPSLSSFDFLWFLITVCQLSLRTKFSVSMVVSPQPFQLWIRSENTFLNFFSFFFLSFIFFICKMIMDVFWCDRYASLTGSKKYLMMAPCVTYYGQIQRILLTVGVWVPVVRVSSLVAAWLHHLTTQITLITYAAPIS